MNVKLLKILRGVGLTDKQARVYLSLLELGEGTVQEIGRRTVLKRTGIYPILDELKKKKLAVETKSRRHTFFVAEDPAVILEEAKLKAEKFARNIGLLNEVRSQHVRKPRVLFFNGTEGFKKIWQVLFKSGLKEYLIITDPREMLSFVHKGYITGKIIKEKIRLGIKSRQLIAFSEYAKEIIIKDKLEGRASKMLPHIYKIPYTTIIFGDRTALISPALEDVIIIIESEAFAKTQSSLFEALWESLSAK